MERTFYFNPTYDSRHTITLKRAAPEWCNYDCPDIWSSDGWRLNSGGTVMEDLPDEIAVLFLRFVLASSEAYYRKYEPGKRENGFWRNTVHDLYKYSGARYAERILEKAFPDQPSLWRNQA